MKTIKYLALALAMLFSTQMKAEEKEETKEKDVPIGFLFQVKNMHLWRGLQITNEATAATEINIKDKNEIFTFGLWGGAGASGKFKEFDYYASIEHSGFKFAVWDIYNFSKDAPYNNRQIFNYSARDTGHFIDVSLAYTFQGKFPLTVSWATVVFGRDRGVENKKNLYTSYVSMSYPVLRQKFVDLDLGIAGAFALSPEKGTSQNFYARSAGIVNVNATISKEIKFGSYYTLPVSVMAMWNPANNDANMQIALDLLRF